MEMQSHQDVLDGREVPEQADVLIGAVDAGGGDPIRRDAVDTMAGEPDLTVIGRIEFHDAVEDRGLAGPIRTDDRVDRAFLDFEIELVDGNEAAEALRHLLRLEQYGSRHHPALLLSACCSAMVSWSSAISRRLAADGHSPSGFTRMTATMARP